MLFGMACGDGEDFREDFLFRLALGFDEVKIDGFVVAFAVFFLFRF